MQGKYTTEQAKQLYKKHNLQFLDKEYINCSFKHLARCLKCGHEWGIRLRNILAKRNCPRCADMPPYTILEIKQIYENNNLEFLESKYKNYNYKNLTLCLKCEHLWKTRIDHVFNGHGCPRCSRGKNEKLTGQFLKELFPNIKINSKTFEVEIFDKNNKKIRNKIIVDFYFELNDKKYIVEYNGVQHYEPIAFRGSSKEKAKIRFYNQQIRNNFLRVKCQAESISLIEINGKIHKGNAIKKFLVSIKDWTI